MFLTLHFLHIEFEGPAMGRAVGLATHCAWSCRRRAAMRRFCAPPTTCSSRTRRGLCGRTPGRPPRTPRRRRRRRRRCTASELW